VLTAAIHKTPIGNLFLVSDDQVLIGAGFRSFRDLLERMDAIDANKGYKEVRKIPVISDLIADYFDGDLNAVNGLKVRQPGTKFSQDVWKVMRKIPAGKTWSYAQLADRAGNPNAIRAAGTVCGKNIIAPIIPCHRVVKTNGDLGNYGYGVSIKEWLLTHEGAL
jgi:methylated-DNA-[protein]-cysteine S-methyltransferase